MAAYNAQAGGAGVRSPPKKTTKQASGRCGCARVHTASRHQRCLHACTCGCCCCHLGRTAAALQCCRLAAGAQLHCCCCRVSVRLQLLLVLLPPLLPLCFQLLQPLDENVLRHLLALVA